MRIVVNATVTSQREKTGIAMFTTNLLRAMKELPQDNSYDVFTLLDPELESWDGARFRLHSLPGIFSSAPVELNWACWYAWYYTAFGMQMGCLKPDVYLSFDFSLPGYRKCPRACMVYDLTPLVLEGAYPDRFRNRFRMQVAHAVKHADRVITISKAVKKDIQQYLGVDPNRIEVVYPGYDESFFTAEGNPAADQVVLDRHGIDYPYILFMGALEQKKNVPRLIEAYEKVWQESNISHRLVLGGKRAWNDKEIFEKITRSPVGAEIIYIGYVPRSDLPALLRGAELFVFPSLNEGFGIPPLEAMACGVPVITSNVSALPELAGGAGLLVDPYKVDDIAQAIVKALSEPAFRLEMKERGLERARSFSWRKSAADMLNILAGLAAH